MEYMKIQSKSVFCLSTSNQKQFVKFEIKCVYFKLKNVKFELNKYWKFKIYILIVYSYYTTTCIPILL